ncbi:MAG: TetR family transcriptional regulator [Kiritimatiellia bacterium]
MRRTKKEAMATRDAILRVALDCFSKKGYTLTTFDDIAKRIHLTKGAVFWHFKSKEALLAEIILQEHQRYKPLQGLEDATLEGIRDIFLAWGNAIMTQCETKRFMLFAMSRVEWNEALKASLTKRLIAMGFAGDPFVRFEAKITALKAEGEIVSSLEPTEIAVLFCALFFGVLRESLLNKRAVNVEATLRTGFDLIIQGIRRK